MTLLTSTRFCRASFALAGLIGFAACNSFGEPGSPCGGGQGAEASGFLPDTGINHGAELLVRFIQHNTTEHTEFAVDQMWANGAMPDIEPEARLRLVRSDGLVLVDTVGVKYRVPTSMAGRPGFLAYGVITDASVRNAWWEGFKDDNLWIELWHPGASAPGTRVRLHTTRREIEPFLRCL